MSTETFQSENPSEVSFRSKRMNRALWTIQALLALVFLFAGGTKLILPIEMLTSMDRLTRLHCRVRSCGSSEWLRCLEPSV
jgi:hypothetical protein